MSDARTDFFASGSKTGKPQKAAPNRDEFFASGDATLADTEKKAAARKNLAFSNPYDYFDPAHRQAAGIDDSKSADLGKVAAGGAAGFNRGVAELVGFPATTAQNVVDLGGMAYSAGRSALTGEDPNELYQLPDRAKIPLTGPWLAAKMDSTPLGNLTENPYPNFAPARVAHATGAGIPSGLVGGGGAAPVAAGAAGGAASALTAEAGGDEGMQAMAGMLGGAAGAALASRPRPAAPPPDPVVDEISAAQAKMNKAVEGQSMGAAAAAPDIKSLSPDLQQAVVKATQETGGAVNPDALVRHVQADSLPVKVQLSKGQALGDERLISIEMNARGKHEEFSKGFRAQNEALTENLRAMRDETGPDVFSTNPVEHADTLIARYQAIDDARNQQIGANYQALRDAAGGEFPVDAKALLANSQKALKTELKQHDAPPSVMRTLEELAATDTMTFEQFEHLRTNLANIQRQNPDGNVRHAAGLIRKEMESLPLKGGAADLKPLADAARASAKERFDALKADPAYKAAVEGAQPDKFVQKYVIGGNRDQVALLAKAMEGDAAAQQTLKVATLDHLRQAAGVDPGYNGNFTQAGYNKALRQLEPKLGSLLDAKTADTARTLGDVARYTQFQPKGSFVNNSNTFVSAAAEKAADALEGAINYKAGGIPVASYVRKTMNDNKLRKQAAETFAPGAGLTKLSDLAKVGKEKK